MTWERVKVGSISKQVRGVAYDKADLSPDASETHHAVVRANNIQDGEVVLDDLVFVSTKKLSPQQYLREGDVLIAASSGSLSAVGKAARVRKGMDVAFGAFCKVIRPNHGEVDLGYFAHYFQSQQYRSTISSLAQGANINNIRNEHINNLEIPLPPLPVQQRIAAVLDEVDALRQKRDRSINSLEALRESAYILHLSENQASSTRVRVSELIDPHRGGMRTGPFGSQLLHSEFVDDPGGIMVLGIDNAVKNRFRYTGERFITPEKYEGLRRYTVHPGDVLVTIMGTCGRAAIVPSDIPTAINTKHLCAMTLNERCLPEYLHATLTYNHSVLKQMGASARGAIMDGLNMGIISGLEFDLPDISNQRKLQQVFAEIDSLNNKALHARGIEDALLSSIQTRAFSGELALRDLEALL